MVKLKYNAQRFNSIFRFPEEAEKVPSEKYSSPNTIKSFQLVNGAFKYSKRSPSTYESLNLEFKVGCLYGLIGKSGSGKSTLLKNLIGILDLSFGTILINGNQVTELREIWGNIGYMDQNTIVFPGMNIRDNLQFGLHKVSE